MLLIILYKRAVKQKKKISACNTNPLIPVLRQNPIDYSEIPNILNWSENMSGVYNVAVRNWDRKIAEQKRSEEFLEQKLKGCENPEMCGVKSCENIKMGANLRALCLIEITAKSGIYLGEFEMVFYTNKNSGLCR